MLNPSIRPIDVSDRATQSARALPSPRQLKVQQPVSRTLETQIARQRQAIKNVVGGRDERHLVVVGPCSIHDSASAMEYAHKLRELATELSDGLLIAMRCYFEKPRTTVGWKGLLYDPDMDGSERMDVGLHKSRQVALQVAELGLPIATECLSPLAAHYLDDLYSWVAIGARTTESQIHREMAATLPVAVGLKNATSGDVSVATNACLAIRAPQSLLSITPTGEYVQVTTPGNPDVQVILRGGSQGPNYHKEAVQAAAQCMSESGLTPSIMVDCSHANCQKQHQKQLDVLDDIGQQIAAGDKSLRGSMLESHLVAGRQNISEGMRFGQSITDPCLGWEDTVTALRQLHERVNEGLLSPETVSA